MEKVCYWSMNEKDIPAAIKSQKKHAAFYCVTGALSGLWFWYSTFKLGRHLEHLDDLLYIKN